MAAVLIPWPCGIKARRAPLQEVGVRIAFMERSLIYADEQFLPQPWPLIRVAGHPEKKD